MDATIRKTTCVWWRGGERGQRALSLRTMGAAHAGGPFQASAPDGAARTATTTGMGSRRKFATKCRSSTGISRAMVRYWRTGQWGRRVLVSMHLGRRAAASGAPRGRLKTTYAAHAAGKARVEAVHAVLRHGAEVAHVARHEHGDGGAAHGAGRRRQRPAVCVV